jgi:hypothetical protein
MNSAGKMPDAGVGGKPETAGYVLTMQESNERGYWITKPDNGDLIILGVSNPQRKQEDAIEEALNNAAQKIALYQGTKGKITTVLKTGSGFLDFYANTTAELDYKNKDFEPHKQALTHDGANDVLQIDGAVLVRFRYRSSNQLNLDYNFIMKDNKPEWIKDPPGALSGFISAVGYAKQQRRIKDTIEKSYENALAAMIAGMDTKITNISHVNESSGGTKTNSGTFQFSEGEIVEFYVLEIWIDPDDKSVWTLAIAKPK